MEDTGALQKELMDALKEYEASRQELAKVSIRLSQSRRRLAQASREAVLRGREVGALGGKNADERKQNLEIWLAQDKEYASARMQTQGFEDALRQAEADLDAAAARLRILETVFKVLAGPGT